MLKINTIKSKLFFKFIISYTAMFVLPMIIFLIFIYVSVFHNLEEEIIENYEARFSENVLEVDTLVSDIIGISHQINSNIAFTSEYLNSQPASYIDIISSLSAVIETNKNIVSAMYYNTDNPDFIYTSDGTLNLKYADTYLYNDEVLDFNDFLGELNKNIWISKSHIVQNIKISSNSPFDNQYIVPLDDGKGRFLIFNLDNNIFSMFNDSTVNTTITTSDGHILFNTDFLPDDADRINLVDDSSYFFNITQSISLDEMFAESKQMQTKSYILFFILMIVGGVFAYIMAINSYKPIADLNKFAKEHSKSEIPNKLSDIDATKHAFLDIIEQNSEISRKKDIQKFFLFLIYDKFSNQTQFQTELLKLGIDFSGKYFCVALAQNVKNLGILEKDLNEFFKCYTLDYADEDSYLVFICVDCQNELLKLQDYKSDVKFFVGSFVSNPYHLSNSFMETYSLLNAETDSNVNIFNKNVKTLVDDRAKMELMSLEKAILNSDIEKIELFTDLIMEKAKLQKNNIYIIVLIYLDCIDIYKNSCNEMNIQNLCHILDEKKDKALHWNELETIINKAKEVTINSLNETKYSIYPIKEYIDINYTKDDLYLGSVAEHFNVSVTVLSSNFKNQLGINISDYIANVKHKYAKELLQNENLTIDEISRILGYSHPSSFIRNFKKKEGVTPKIFRDN